MLIKPPPLRSEPGQSEPISSRWVLLFQLFGAILGVVGFIISNSQTNLEPVVFARSALYVRAHSQNWNVSSFVRPESNYFLGVGNGGVDRA